MLRPGSHAATGLVALVAALVAVSALAAPAAAGERSDTETIDPGSSTGIAIDFQDAPALRVSYDIDVREGPNIDILVMDNANLQKYRDQDSFKYVASWSVLDAGSAVKEFTLEEHGTWHVVLDHTDRPDNGAQPATVGAEQATVAWTISTQVDVERSAEDGFAGLPASGAALAASGLVAAGVLVRVRRP